MKLLLITETLLAGGAEWFVLRFADAMQKNQHKVILLVMRGDLIDSRLTARYPEIEIRNQPTWMVKTAVLIDRIWNKLFGSAFALKLINRRLIEKLIREVSPDVIHSHLLNTDEVVAMANRRTRIKHITTIHGDYIQAIKQNDEKILCRINRVIDHLDQVAAISDEQIAILISFAPQIKPKLSKIYNGYPKQHKGSGQFDKKAIKFGMIARGIPEKGWEPAIKAFLMLDNPNARLYLYSDSSYIDSLRQRFTDDRIIFAGFTNDPVKAVQDLDIGLLPSYYDAESLPTTIIEYLALNKPVIATAVGEIRNMIGTEEGPAGILIEDTDPDSMVEPLFKAMESLSTNEQLYSTLSGNSRKAFDRFSMEYCLENYLNLYAKPKTCVE